jgi:hypothetical protein
VLSAENLISHYRRIEISGSGRALLDDDRARAAYLGL